MGSLKGRVIGPDLESSLRSSLSRFARSIRPMLQFSRCALSKSDLWPSTRSVLIRATSDAGLIPTAWILQKARGWRAPVFQYSDESSVGDVGARLRCVGETNNTARSLF